MATPAGRLAILELVFHALDSPWALEIIRGVEQMAREHELAVVLTEMEGQLTPGRAWTEQVLARWPTGVSAVFSELTVSQQSQLAVRNVPLVVVDPTGEPLHETPSVGATNWNGGLAATRHLVGLGHRRVAMLCGRAARPATCPSGGTGRLRPSATARPRHSHRHRPRLRRRVPVSPPTSW